MRKLLSIALLAILGLPFASPLLALATRGEQRLPACCRRDGRHHCTAPAPDDSSQPQFTSPTGRCPFTATVPSGMGGAATVMAAQALYAGLRNHPAVVASTQTPWRASRGGSRHKRGPPHLSLS